MLGVIFGLMVMGCPAEDNSKKDDGPETIATEYRGVFKEDVSMGGGEVSYIEITKNRFIDYQVMNNAPNKKNIYRDYAARNNDKDIYFTVTGQLSENKAGYFDNVDKFIYTYLSNGGIGNKSYSRLK